MIFVDANIFMYAAGDEHPHKAPCVDFIRAIAEGDIGAALTSVEVLQEILHRYRAINRWEEGALLYDSVRTLVDFVDVTLTDTDRARSLMDQYPALSARDALHAAVAHRTGASTICSYDRGFDVIPGLRRRTPDQLEL